MVTYVSIDELNQQGKSCNAYSIRFPATAEFDENALCQ